VFKNNLGPILLGFQESRHEHGTDRDMTNSQY